MYSSGYLSNVLKKIYLKKLWIRDKKEAKRVQLFGGYNPYISSVIATGCT
jgi:hypothetical protein